MLSISTPVAPAVSAQTQADGTYTITGLAPGQYRVQVSTSGTDYVSEYYNNVLSSSQATPVTVVAGQTTQNINFGLATGGKITGKVTKDGTTDPIAGLSVYAYFHLQWLHGPAPRPRRTGRTPSPAYRRDNTGFRSTPASSGTYYVFEYYNNVRSSSQATPVNVMAGQTTPNINFGLSTGGKISGYVKDEAGNPIGNMGVCVSNGSGGTTQANGYYETWSNPPGSYQVWVKPQQNNQYYVQEWYNNSPTSTGAASVPVAVGPNDSEHQFLPGFERPDHRKGDTGSRRNAPSGG